MKIKLYLLICHFLTWLKEVPEFINVQHNYEKQLKILILFVNVLATDCGFGFAAVFCCSVIRLQCDMSDSVGFFFVLFCSYWSRFPSEEIWRILNQVTKLLIGWDCNNAAVCAGLTLNRSLSHSEVWILKSAAFVCYFNFSFSPENPN